MGKNPYAFPVCSSYKTTTNTSKVVLLTCKSSENLETEASSALQEMGRDKQEVNWGKLAEFGKRRCIGQNWEGFTVRGCGGDLWSPCALGQAQPPPGTLKQMGPVLSEQRLRTKQNMAPPLKCI